ncbi:hypothetical protein AAP_00440 [Ascosphaera apis ARSEF 7405]|uniref:Uncharacterized protein n=1 Tax=Ascosphaera apis ARSEF 7405 TaxID=392613 RepID=A0A168DW59_9EURO|nr:hypothetical protein AAP_00440 [Ascosphaera apis ARSEF 7405]
MPEASPPFPSLSQEVSSQAATMMAAFNSKMKLVAEVTSAFDQVASKPHITADSSVSALLQRIQLDIKQFVQCNFTVSDLHPSFTGDVPPSRPSTPRTPPVAPTSIPTTPKTPSKPTTISYAAAAARVILATKLIVKEGPWRLGMPKWFLGAHPPPPD